MIRRMAEADVPAVHEIDVLSFSLPWPERSFRFELTNNPVSRCWVAEMNGCIAAMIVVWMIVDEAHVATIATHPEFRRQGIGERLLAHALLSAKADGAIKSLLEVRVSNEAAQTLYRRFGYVEDGRRVNYYKDNNEDALLMSLDLANFDFNGETP